MRSDLLEELGKLKEADVTSELWLDFYETWASFLALRPKLEGECAQQLFDAVTADNAAFKGLGAAHLFRDAVIKQGRVPTELLLQLKQGPGKHMKKHAYAYRKKIDSEMTRIARIKDLQQRAVALTGTALVAVFVGISNVLGQLYLTVLQSGTPVLAAAIAGIAVGSVLLVCIIFAACVRQMRRK